MKSVLKKLERFIPRGKLTRGVLVASSGNIAAILLTLMASPVITRLYSPSDFGLLGVFMALIYSFGVISTLRYEAAISLPEKEGTGANLTILCVVVSCLVAAILALTAFVFEDVVWSIGTIADLRPFGLIFLMTLIAYAGYEAYSFWVIRHQNFKKLAVIRSVYGLGTVGTQITAGLLAVGTIGLVSGPLVGYGLGVLFLIFVLTRTPGFASSLAPSKMKEAAVRYREFPFYSTPATLLLKVHSHLPTLLMASLYSLEVAGWSALAQRVVANPLAALGQPVSRVYFSRAAQLLREKKPGLRDLFVRTLSKVLKLGVLPMVIGMVLAPVAFSIIFGENWYEAGVYCRILAPMIFIQLLALVLSASLDVLEKQKFQLLASFIGTVLTGAAIYLSYRLGFSARTMMIVLSGAAILGYVITIWISWGQVRRSEAAMPVEETLPEDSEPM